jgi:hypothetical protein
MSLLLIFILVILFIAICGGGGWYGSRAGWWGRSNRNADYGDPNFQSGIPFGNGSGTPPSPAGSVQQTPIQPIITRTFNPFYYVIIIIVVILLLALVFALLGGWSPWMR